MNSTLDLIHNRISLRRYDDRPVSEEDLNTIIQGALRAPTAGNMMNYSIIVVKDEEKKKRLSITCDNQPFIANAPVLLIFLADMQRLYDYFSYSDVERYSQEKGLEFKEPGYANLFLATSDALISAQNAVITAESIGIGSCYIGDIVENYEIHKEMFNLPDKVFPISMLTLGYYPKDMKRVKKSRFDKKYIVYNEEYRRLEDIEFKDMYRDLEEKLTSDNKFGAENYGQYLYERKFGTEFFAEMERSIQLILKHWMNKNK